MKIRIVILLVWIAGYALRGVAGERDTDLVHLYETLPPNETWMRITETLLLTDRSDFEESIIRATSLYTEAKSLGNEYYIRRACYFLVIANYRLSRLQEMNRWLGVYQPLARKAGALDEMYECWRCVIYSCIGSMDFQRALEENRTMLDDAEKAESITGVFGGNVCLGALYLSMGCYDRSLEILEQTKAYFSLDGHALYKLSCLGYQAMAYMKKDEKKNVLAVLREMNGIIDTTQTNRPDYSRSYEDIRLLISSLYAYVCLKGGDLARAKQCLLKASEWMAPERLGEYKVLYYESYSLYCQLSGQYEQALEWNDSVLLYGKNSLKDYLHYTIQRADIMRASGDLYNAYHTYRKQAELLDSVSVVIYTKQLDQIKENYQAKQLALHYDKLKVYASVGITILLTACLVYIAWMFRKVKRAESHLKETNREVEEALKKVEKLNETKSNFLRNMSYCVRLPLNAVMGFSQILSSAEEDALLDDETREKVAQIVKTNSGNLMELVNSILDLSRLESGMMKYALSDCDMVQVCNDAMAMARMKEGNMAVITFDNQVESQLIHSDEGRLMVIISSMLQDFVSEKRRLIILTLRKDDAQRMLKVDVENTPFANLENDNQQLVIQREVARLFIEHFGGTFKMEAKAVHFTYPYL